MCHADLRLGRGWRFFCAQVTAWEMSWHRERGSRRGRSSRRRSGVPPPPPLPGVRGAAEATLSAPRRRGAGLRPPRGEGPRGAPRKSVDGSRRRRCSERIHEFIPELYVLPHLYDVIPCAHAAYACIMHDHWHRARARARGNTHVTHVYACHCLAKNVHEFQRLERDDLACIYAHDRTRARTYTRRARACGARETSTAVLAAQNFK